ncbi:Cytochrome P450 4V2 like protein [Argiope bruennichi]|uniref:Cytochrome P450 4V2 like protein n=1 Tax=Argiope bruennichi TaxID=94029 RepID=A0A8T0E152_ARGBR|nr:Cytochrome P450 4V2 like protein [Argiope bruennichi]
MGIVSSHVRDFEVMCGHHYLFSHEGLSSTWYLFHEITIFKADVVELVEIGNGKAMVVSTSVRISLTRLYIGLTLSTIVPLLDKAFSKALEVTRDLTNKIIFQKIKERKENKQNAIPVNEDSLHKHTQSQLQKSAFMDLLVEEHLKNNSLSENDIKQEVDSFVFAGHDTTSVTMSWCLWMIGLHPWIQDKIHEELDIIFGEDDRESTVEDLNNMKYLECVVKETMRLYPPVPIIAREIRNDIQYGKYTIPKDSTCVVYAYVLHRDPDVFPDPERFDPERFTPENSAGRNPFAYVPFSAGPRNCLGQRFAMLEIKILLSSILRRYKMRSLDPRDKVHTLAEMVLRPSNGLRIQVRRRDQSFDFHSVYYRPPEESLVSQLKIT